MTELTTEQLTQLYQEWSAIGEKRERERITKKLLYVMSQPNFRWGLWLTTEDDLLRFLNKGED